MVQGADEVVLVQELQPGVVPEDGGDHREPEVLGQRGRDGRADGVGGAQHRDRDVGTAAGEAADVALDLQHVLGVAGPRQPLGSHVLGEHRRVAARGAVDGARRLHHEPLQPGCLLARGEQLHGADDVVLLDRGAAAAGAALGGRLHAEVHHRVDVLTGDHLRDHRVADVGADERHPAEVGARRGHVDPDHPRHRGVLADAAREPATEASGDSGDENDAPHDVRPRVRRATCPGGDAGCASS